MLKKLLSLSLVALLINLAGMAPAYAASKEEKQARFAGISCTIRPSCRSTLVLWTRNALRSQTRLAPQPRSRTRRSRAFRETISPRAQKLLSESVLPQPSFLRSFGIQPDPAVTEDAPGGDEDGSRVYFSRFTTSGSVGRLPLDELRISF